MQLPELVPLGVLAVALLVSVVTDLRRRLIYNVVTLPALAIVLGCFWLGGGREALWSSLIGVAVCAGPFLLASIPGWIGMGDAKLMAVVGAAAGWPSALGVILYVSIAGGAQAAAQLLWARLRGHDRPKYVPYAVAIAAGTCAAWLMGDRLLQ